MLLATMFVTLPFIVRELIPTLEQMDLAQEEAAKTLGANPLQVSRLLNPRRWPFKPQGQTRPGV
jgi:ABC-type sulfate transport system permease subunit